jgi:hypothetical protein
MRFGKGGVLPAGSRRYRPVERVERRKRLGQVKETLTGGGGLASTGEARQERKIG